MRPLWTCPTCERFISANLWHSCLRSEDDVDRNAARWMRRAYRFGRQDHLR
jgi:hypothetical protein